VFVKNTVAESNLLLLRPGSYKLLQFGARLCQIINWCSFRPGLDDNPCGKMLRSF